MQYIINLAKKAWNFVRTYKKTSVLILVALMVVGYFAFFRSSPSTVELVKVQTGDVIQEVSVTGRVKSAEAVDMAFERSGRISSVNVKVGDKVRTGQALVRLEASELYAQRTRELADIESAKQRINQLVSNANLKGDKDVAASALESAINGLVLFTDLQIQYFTVIDADSVASLKEKSVISIYGDYPGGLNSPYFFVNLNSGLKAEINQPNPDYSSIFGKVENALTTVKLSLETLRAKLLIRNADPSSVAGLDASINNLFAQINAINTQRRTTVGGYYDIDIARTQLTQAEANLALLDAQLSKLVLTAPFNGTVTAVSVERGEISNPGTPAVSVIGQGNLEIEAQISEADISKLKIGNDVKVTLDAYGSEEIFMARLVHIDPAGKVSDGVAVYSATFQFVDKNEKILPGLTADLDIKTDERKNVLYMPSRDVISKDSKKYAKVLVEKNSSDSRFANLTAVSEEKSTKVFEVEIKTGLKGSDGRIEIISGLHEGDQIVKE